MNIYVGNISYSMTEEELKDVFGQFGNVTSVKIIVNKHTGRSKGFGFVEVEEEDGAQKAIEELNDTELGGRNLRVSEAISKE